MPQDYYIILTTGMVSKVAAVTATPTIVDEDFKQGVYRDVFQNFPQSSGVVIQGPDWTITPVYVAGAISNYTLEKDDVIDHVAPRSLTWPETHWRFVTTGGDYFTPTRYVVSMSTEQPTI